MCVQTYSVCSDAKFELLGLVVSMVRCQASLSVNSTRHLSSSIHLFSLFQQPGILQHPIRPERLPATVIKCQVLLWHSLVTQIYLRYIVMVMQAQDTVVGLYQAVLRHMHMWTGQWLRSAQEQQLFDSPVIG